MGIKLIVTDIDGTMTDGSIYYGENGTEIKKFNVKDAAGILAAQAVGIECMFLTGRKSEAVERRANDLNVSLVFQGICNKGDFLKKYLSENGMANDSVMYIGDDLNDYQAIMVAGRSGCPYDAAGEIKQRCHYISDYKGGEGAVRDIIFKLLEEEGLLDNAIKILEGRSIK